MFTTQSGKIDTVATGVDLSMEMAVVASPLWDRRVVPVMQSFIQKAAVSPACYYPLLCLYQPPFAAMRLSFFHFFASFVLATSTAVAIKIPSHKHWGRQDPGRHWMFEDTENLAPITINLTLQSKLPGSPIWIPCLTCLPGQNCTVELGTALVGVNKSRVVEVEHAYQQLKPSQRERCFICPPGKTCIIEPATPPPPNDTVWVIKTPTNGGNKANGRCIACLHSQLCKVTPSSIIMTNSLPGSNEVTLIDNCFTCPTSEQGCWKDTQTFRERSSSMLDFREWSPSYTLSEIAATSWMFGEQMGKLSDPTFPTTAEQAAEACRSGKESVIIEGNGQVPILSGNREYCRKTRFLTAHRFASSSEIHCLPKGRQRCTFDDQEICRCLPHSSPYQ